MTSTLRPRGRLRLCTGSARLECDRLPVCCRLSAEHQGLSGVVMGHDPAAEKFDVRLDDGSVLPIFGACWRSLGTPKWHTSCTQHTQASVSILGTWGTSCMYRKPPGRCVSIWGSRGTQATARSG